MSVIIKKIRLVNYKKFEHYVIEPNNKVNILVGDNEAGKSTILQAIDLVTSGSVKKVEKIGFENLINKNAINSFLQGEKRYEDLPQLIIELYLEGKFNFEMNGRNNEEGVTADGIRLKCYPNEDYVNEIVECCKQDKSYFPYEYYSMRFSTFSDVGYSGFKHKIKSVYIDSGKMNTTRTMNEFVKTLYKYYTEDCLKERVEHKKSYRLMKSKFVNESFKALNETSIQQHRYQFGLRSASSSDIENDLMIYEDNIPLDSRGTGKQAIIKTEFALRKAGEGIDIILIEEPENHLTHVNLRKLLQDIKKNNNGQMFITTHSSLISTKLELKNVLLMSKENLEKPIALDGLSADTATYFMKAPPASILEFILSQKVLLVEGPSEFILMDKFYQCIAGNTPESDGVQIIDIRGLSFKRFLEVALSVKTKVAVLTDNDGDIVSKCESKYKDYENTEEVSIFYCENEELSTFEKVLYYENKQVCDDLFGDNALTKMLKNKTDSALELVSLNNEIKVPKYIEEAIKWIKE